MDYSALLASDGDGEAIRATVQSPGRDIGSSVIPVNAVTHYPTGTLIGTTGTLQANNTITNAQVFYGTASGTSITITSFAPGYTDLGNAVGDVVVIKPTTEWANIIGTHIMNITGNGTPENITVANAAVGGTLAVTGVLTPAGGFPNNTITAAELATNAITLGYEQITSNLTTGSTSETLITGLSVNVTIPSGNRKVRVTVNSSTVSSSGIAIVKIYDGTFGSGGTQIGQFNQGSSNGGCNAVAVYTPTAGAKTYTATVSSTSGDPTVGATTGAPAFILVEAI